MGDIKLKIENITEIAADELSFDLGLDVSDGYDGDWDGTLAGSDFKVDYLPITYDPTLIDQIDVTVWAPSAGVSATTRVVDAGVKSNTQHHQGTVGQNYTQSLRFGKGPGNGYLPYVQLMRQSSIATMHVGSLNAVSSYAFETNWLGGAQAQGVTWSDGVDRPTHNFEFGFFDVSDGFAKVATYRIKLKAGQTMPSNISEMMPLMTHPLSEDSDGDTDANTMVVSDPPWSFATMKVGGNYVDANNVTISGLDINNNQGGDNMSFKFKILGVALSDSWPSEQKLSVWSDDTKSSLLFEGNLAADDLGGAVVPEWTMTGVNSISAGMFFELEDLYDDGMLSATNPAIPVQFSIRDASDVEQFQGEVAVGTEPWDYLFSNSGHDKIEMKVNGAGDGFEYIQVPGGAAGGGDPAPAVPRTRINHDQLAMPSHDEYAAQLAGTYLTPTLAAEAGAEFGTLVVQGLPLEYVGVDIAEGDYSDGTNQMIVNKGKLDAVESALAAQQAADMTAALNAINTVAGDLASYEGSNDAAVNVERERIDAILSGSGVDLDQLVELVAAYELADSNIISTITGIQNANATDEQNLADHLAAYATKMGLLDAEDLQIRADFDAADVAAFSASVVREQAIQTELTNHKSAYSTKMGLLDAEDLQIRADFATADATLHGTISAEIDADVAAQEALASADRNAVRSEFAAADVAAFSASVIREQAIQTELTNHKSAYNTKMGLLDAEDLQIRSDLGAEIDADVAAQEILASADRNAVRAEFAAADDAAFSASVIREQAIQTELTNHKSAYNTKMGLLDAEDTQIRVDFAAADDAAFSASVIREQAIQTELTNHKSAYDTKMGLLEAEDADIRVDFAAADTTLQSNIDTVAGDLSSYETSNDAAVQVERARIDAILSGSGVDLDQLVELVAAYELADSDIISTITTLQGTVATNKSDLSASIAAVASDLESYETSNDLALGNEVTARQTLEGEFDAHVVAYTAKMGLLDAEDLQIRSDLAAEIDSDIAAQEILALADRNAVRSEFAAADVAAFSASVIREQAIQSDLDTHKNAYGVKMGLLDAEDTQIRVDFAAADTALHGVISAEIDSDIVAQEALALADRNAVRAEFAAADVSALSASVSREQAIQSDLDTHKNAYGVKMGLLDQEDIDIRADFATADATLQGNIDAVAGDLVSYETSNDLEVADVKSDLASLYGWFQNIEIAPLGADAPGGLSVHVVNDLGLVPVLYVISITLNGMVLRNGEDYSFDPSGTVLTISVPLMAGDKLSGVALKQIVMETMA